MRKHHTRLTCLARNISHISAHTRTNRRRGRPRACPPVHSTHHRWPTGTTPVSSGEVPDSDMSDTVAGSPAPTPSSIQTEAYGSCLFGTHTSSYMQRWGM
jgi:hypothetical protein